MGVLPLTSPWSFFNLICQTIPTKKCNMEKFISKVMSHTLHYFCKQRSWHTCSYLYSTPHVPVFVHPISFCFNNSLQSNLHLFPYVRLLGNLHPPITDILRPPIFPFGYGFNALPHSLFFHMFLILPFPTIKGLSASFIWHFPHTITTHSLSMSDSVCAPFLPYQGLRSSPIRSYMHPHSLHFSKVLYSAIW